MDSINFKIDKLLKKYNYSQRQVALDCNIRPTTLKMYVDNTIQRVNIKDLENLYNYFHNLDNKIILSDIISTNSNSLFQDLEHIDTLFSQDENIDCNLIDAFVQHIIDIFSSDCDNKSFNFLILASILENEKMNEKLVYTFRYLANNYKDDYNLNNK